MSRLAQALRSRLVPVRDRSAGDRRSLARAIARANTPAQRTELMMLAQRSANGSRLG